MSCTVDAHRRDSGERLGAFTLNARGIRNHNPGNIRIGDLWKGLANRVNMTDEQRAERSFCVFAGPAWGIRALAKILLTYQRKYGLYTIEDIITRWAPPVENDTESYIESVAARSGFERDEVVEISRAKVARPIIEAIILHENGRQPYDWPLKKGIELAGIK